MVIDFIIELFGNNFSRFMVNLKRNVSAQNHLIIHMNENECKQNAEMALRSPLFSCMEYPL